LKEKQAKIEWIAAEGAMRLQGQDASATKFLVDIWLVLIQMFLPLPRTGPRFLLSHRYQPGCRGRAADRSFPRRYVENEAGLAFPNQDF
jgi:hypothetical protein